jgi:CheY-like chemotaxis protein
VVSANRQGEKYMVQVAEPKMVGKTILVVDDDANFRLLCQEILTDEGYDVILAGNGSEAIKKVDQNEPDLVVLDILMPQMDGLEALPQILRKHKKTPVILNTGYTKYKEDFMSWAADAYVLKSSDLRELKEAIQHLLTESYLNRNGQ